MSIYATMSDSEIAAILVTSVIDNKDMDEVVRYAESKGVYALDIERFEGTKEDAIKLIDDAAKLRAK